MIALRSFRRVAGVVAALLALYGVVNVTQVVVLSRRDEARSSDAIVVLGAAQYNGQPSPVLKRRLDHALALRKRGIAKIIVVTGGRAPGDKFTEATASARYLHDHGVADGQILREVTGRNTWDSLASAAGFLRGRGIGRVVLVTDGYHSARAKAMAKALGMDALVSPVPGTGVGFGDAGQVFRESTIYGLGRIVGFPRLLGIKRNLQRVSRSPIGE